MITIAIPTYNRLDLLSIMAQSLYASGLPDGCNIRIYDDCSGEYGIAELKQIFPNAASITRNEVNLRADTNMFAFYKDFLNSSDEYLFNADSDLIFNKNWFARALELIRRTDGVLSIFNATSHSVKKTIDDDLCIKETIGAAGTFFVRNRVEEIINHFSSLDGLKIESFDWRWCRFFNDNNIRICCTNNSFVQHIGYHGQNASVTYKGYKDIKTIKPFFDFGRNFKIDTIETGQIINNIFERFIDQNRTEEERIIKLLPEKEKPLKKIKKAIKRLIHYES